jgi:hypothetical protein
MKEKHDGMAAPMETASQPEEAWTLGCPGPIITSRAYALYLLETFN